VHDMTATLGRVEISVAEIKAMLSATLPHLAAKAELAEPRLATGGETAQLRQAMTADIAEPRRTTTADIAGLHQATTPDFTHLRVELADKPGKAYMCGVLTALPAAHACGPAALALLK
jgi:hypothetical protein